MIPTKGSSQTFKILTSSSFCAPSNWIGPLAAAFSFMIQLVFICCIVKQVVHCQQISILRLSIPQFIQTPIYFSKAAHVLKYWYSEHLYRLRFILGIQFRFQNQPQFSNISLSQFILHRVMSKLPFLQLLRLNFYSNLCSSHCVAVLSFINIL